MSMRIHVQYLCMSHHARCSPFTACFRTHTGLHPPQGLPFRLLFRSSMVIAIGVVGILLPFFNDIVGLVGALGFWPISVFFPIECWIRVYKPSPRKRLWLRVCGGGTFKEGCVSTMQGSPKALRH